MNMSKMPIAFGGTFVDDTTRALDDPSYGEGKLIDQFTAWGIVRGNVGSSNLYGGDGTVVSRGGAAYGSPFNSDEQEWWIPSATYRFAAVANHESVTLTNGLPSSITYTADNTDLIYAKPVTVNTNELASPIQSTGTPYVGVNEYGCVPFVFSHLLSKVYFTFVSTSQPLAVTDVKVTGHFAKGTYTINDQQWSETTPAPATTALIFGDADGQVTTECTTSQKACLIIPGKQTWIVSLNQGDEKKTATLTDFVFEPNKAYNILVTLQGASQITFKVNPLEAWGEEKNVNLNF